MPPRTKTDTSKDDADDAQAYADASTQTAEPNDDESTGEYEGNDAAVEFAKAAAGEPAGSQHLAKGEKDVYVVLTDAVTLRIGKEQGAVIRVRKGQLVKIEDGHKYIDREYLERLGAIAPNDGKPKKAATARALAAAAGAPDDPVNAPVSQIVRDTTVTPANDPTVTS